MKKIKLDRYESPRGFLLAIENNQLKKNKEGLLLDMTNLPENYEIVIRNIIDKRKQQIIYQNFKERE